MSSAEDHPLQRQHEQHKQNTHAPKNNTHYPPTPQDSHTLSHTHFSEQLPQNRTLTIPKTKTYNPNIREQKQKNK